jgi:hypothetical protein
MESRFKERYSNRWKTIREEKGDQGEHEKG